MTRCSIFTHKDCLDHDTGAGHPEQVARLTRALSALRQPAFSGLDWQDAPKATVEQLTAVHDPEYVDDVLASAPASGHANLDADTVISKGSVDAALRSAGAVVAAVDHVMAGKADTAFCAVRPPGHHAEHGKAMGFCIFGNAAVGALHAVNAHGLERVAVIDFDVHHGNGTANLVDGRKEVFFVSTHQAPPFYPGTGKASETGKLGNILNVPLESGDGSAEFRKAFTDVILPALDAFKPQLVIVSAGFDAHKDDPLGEINLSEADYAWVTRELRKVADKHAGGKVVSALEGGYNLDALTSCIAAHVDVLRENAAPNPAICMRPPGI
jgi:acetoin utilization deacetylase AcuC-like enzyme